MSKPISIFATWVLTLSAAWAQDLVVAPYLQSARPTSVWICWETSAGAESVVEWGVGEALDQRTEGAAHAGPGTHQHHEVELTGLQPATRYAYRVRTEGLVSDVFHLTTPPADDSEAPTRILAMSDMQRDLGHPDVYRQIIEDGVLPTVRAEFGDELSRALSLAIVPGDLVDNGLVYAEWAETFFGPGAALMASVPVYPVLGNHEVNSPFYFDYFRLPDNGTPGFEEHWWWVDHSNVRVIGLDSNSVFRNQIQLDWLAQVLADACAADHVDFVFAQLHHPFHSELWPDGNSDYTGDVIAQLEAFTTDCGKPSVHFYGHTHGYSRGHSRDHQHLMVNVATAGGNIDFWDEYDQIDYPEHVVSQDDYGFVLLEVVAGEDPLFRLQRRSMGQPDAPSDNVLRDEVLVRLNNAPPNQPQAPGRLGEAVSPACVVLSGGPFVDADGDAHQASHWQVSRECGDFSAPLIDRWRQDQDWFKGVDLQAGDDLTDEIVEGLDQDTGHCWRVRYRDGGLVWSEWSTPEPFTTGREAREALPLLNGDAEGGVAGWRVEQGVFESVEDGECDGGPAFAGRRHFSVGGVCRSSGLAVVSQRLDLSHRAAEVDADHVGVRYGGQLRTREGRDRPDLWVRFLGAADEVLGETEPAGTQATTWTPVAAVAPVPPGTRALELVLRGKRNAGADNDSYFDDLFVSLTRQPTVCAEAIEPGPAPPVDAGVSDAAVSDSEPSDAWVANEPSSEDAPAGCQSGTGPSGLLWVFALLWVRRSTKI